MSLKKAVKNQAQFTKWGVLFVNFGCPRNSVPIFAYTFFLIDYEWRTWTIFYFWIVQNVLISKSQRSKYNNFQNINCQVLGINWIVFGRISAHILSYLITFWSKLQICRKFQPLPPKKIFYNNINKENVSTTTLQ